VYSIYIVQGIISYLEMIQSIQENMWTFCANTVPFYIKELRIFGLWYPLRILEPVLLWYRGITKFCFNPVLQMRKLRHREVILPVIQAWDETASHNRSLCAHILGQLASETAYLVSWLALPAYLLLSFMS
jgi:hypothetical protein